MASKQDSELPSSYQIRNVTKPIHPVNAQLDRISQDLEELVRFI